MYNENFPEFFNQYLTTTPTNQNQLTEELEHPYQQEIESLVFEDSGWASTDPIDPVLPETESKTSYTLVALPDQLALMISELKTQTEIAVDLEHHSYRSYQGFTCLIQISSRTQDYLVDAIHLRSHLNSLNSIFANPQILKVFHGSNSDIKWLQKDFGLYVVNLFDTYCAVQLLNKPPYSLSSLLFRYAKVVTNKEFQLADWRLRP